MTDKITISATPKRLHVFNELMKRDTTGLGLSGMLGVAAQYFVEQEANVCLLPTIDSPPEDLKEYATTCDTVDYKKLQEHSMILENVLRKENARRM